MIYLIYVSQSERSWRSLMRETLRLHAAKLVRSTVIHAKKGHPCKLCRIWPWPPAHGVDLELRLRLRHCIFSSSLRAKKLNVIILLRAVLMKILQDRKI